MNALDIANLIFLLVQTGKLHPEAELVIRHSQIELWNVSDDKQKITITSCK